MIDQDIAQRSDDEDMISDYSDDVSTFGDRIVAAREAVGMTTDELARRLGVKTKTLQAWEDDRSEPRANRLQTLAGLLNVSIMWLMSGNGPGIPNGTGEEGIAEIVEEIRRIREIQAELAGRMVRLERRLITYGQ